MRPTLRRAPLVIVGALFLFCSGVWSVVYAQVPHASGALTFAVMDVGQGDALYIESPTGVQVVVDGGPDDALLEQLPALMPAMDRSLDALIETHPDADHIGGFPNLLERYDVGAFISPGIPKGTATAKRLDAELAAHAVPRLTARRGMTLDLGAGAMLEVLYPDRDVSGLSDSKANDGCIVARLTYKEASALLACDAPASTEVHLLQTDGAALKSEVLKVAHHGSKYSSTPAFLVAVAPRYALISVGAHNTYGHPGASTLKNLADAGADVLRTDTKGTLVCRSDGGAFSCN